MQESKIIVNIIQVRLHVNRRYVKWCNLWGTRKITIQPHTLLDMWQSHVETEGCTIAYSITLLWLRHRIAELPLMAELIRAS